MSNFTFFKYSNISVLLLIHPSPCRIYVRILTQSSLQSGTVILKFCLYNNTRSKLRVKEGKMNKHTRIQNTELRNKHKQKTSLTTFEIYWNSACSNEKPVSGN